MVSSTPNSSSRTPDQRPQPACSHPVGDPLRGGSEQAEDV